MPKFLQESQCIGKCFYHIGKKQPLLRKARVRGGLLKSLSIP